MNTHRYNRTDPEIPPALEYSSVTVRRLGGVVVIRIDPFDKGNAIPKPATREPLLDRFSIERFPVAGDDDGIARTVCLNLPDLRTAGCCAKRGRVNPGTYVLG